MATVEKRSGPSGTRYRARVRVRGERARSRTFSRLTDARAWAAKIQTELETGTYVPTGAERRRTLAGLIDLYIADCLPAKAHNADAHAQSLKLKWWSEHFGYVTLDRLQPEVIAAARAELRRRRTRSGKPISGPTTNRYLAALSAVCKYAVRELRWLPSNPVLHITKAPESAGVVRFLSDDERHRLFAACRQHHDSNVEVAVTLALATGLRYSNIRFLRWEDVDFDTWTLTVARTKNNTARRVPVVGHAQSVLQAHFDRDPNGKGWVFKGQGDARPADIEKHWREVRVMAGLEGFRFHDLRHTVASYLTQNGAGLAQVADVLGHKTLVMARRYSHQSTEHVRATLETVADRLVGDS